MLETQSTPIFNSLQPSVTQIILSSSQCPENLKPYFLHREQKGLQTYGTTLQPFNGRDAAQDCFEELLDGCQYAKQKYLESSDDGDRLFWDEVFLDCLKLASRVQLLYNK